MDFNKFFSSKIFQGILLGISIFIVILIVFKIGMTIGFRKADFSYRWGANYHRNFAGPRAGFFQELLDRDVVETSGTFGQVMKIDGLKIVVKGANDVEKIIVINEKTTTIRRFKETLQPSDLGIDDRIVVIGEPNSAGQIEAKLIRVFPEPPEGGAPHLDILPFPNDFRPL